MPLFVLLVLAGIAALAAVIAARRWTAVPPLATVVVLGLVLAALTALVRSTDGVIGVDTSVAGWADRHASGWSTDALQGVTSLGAAWAVAVAGVLVAVADWRRRSSAGAGPFILAVVLGDKLLSVTLKALVDRARPSLNPVAATLDPSFPSGHSSTAAAFWAAAALVVLRWVPSARRPLVVGAAVGIAVGVAASRVLLDLHWLTDVVAGLALGWGWFTLCAAALGARLLGGVAAPQR